MSVNGMCGFLNTKWLCAMDQRIFVAQLNIEHFRNKLLGETDAATRKRIAGLLAEEEAKLAALLNKPENKQKDKS